MVSYKLVIDKRVRKKDFPKLPAKQRPRIIKLIQFLQANPRPPATQKLTNREEYRLRSGVYRILYIIDDQKRQVVVRAVRHRSRVYKDL